MHAYALELLEEKLKPGARVLDVGSGTGYLTACFAIMVAGTNGGDGSGLAVGIEHIDELHKKSIVNIKKWNENISQTETLKIVCMK
jgi:protein-L-isoaspartate(D-aspartate) O-methyltransferase